MKNIQVIDGADNCAYDIFQCDDEVFYAIFPGNIDIQFSEDIDNLHEDLFEKLWSNPIEKYKANGIHGTLFIDIPLKRRYYPNKKESDLSDSNGRGFNYEYEVVGS